MTDPIRIDIWSDIACPWCWLGKHRMEAALAEFAARPGAAPVEISYHSYQLAPDLPDDYAGSHGDYLKAKLGMDDARLAQANQHLTGLGRDAGIEYRFSETRMANTHKALELLHFAKAHGKEAEVKEALFGAHFRDGVHIGEIPALAAIAEAAGLDGDAAARALREGTHAAGVEADKAEAERIGIRGVPFFVIDSRYGLSGAQEPATFLSALDQALAGRGAS